MRARIHNTKKVTLNQTYVNAMFFHLEQVSTSYSHVLDSSFAFVPVVLGFTCAPTSPYYVSPCSSHSRVVTFGYTPAAAFRASALTPPRRKRQRSHLRQDSTSCRRVLDSRYARASARRAKKNTFWKKVFGIFFNSSCVEG